MSRPVRHLPVLQNWDCHGCTSCCREYQVRVTDEERERITAQGWENDPGFQGLPLFVRAGPRWSRHFELNQRNDGRCIFLSDAGRCRIHERFGAAAKPLVCRVFPFVLVPAGDHWRVGVRYACPSAAANKGRPVPEHESELTGYAAEIDRRSGEAPGPPPPLRRGQYLEWADLLHFNQALLALVRDPSDRLERRLRKCLALVRLCHHARFEKVTGRRLIEFLNLIGAALDGETPADPASLPPPSWVGRSLFRQALAIYSRQDHGPDRGEAARSHLARIAAAWRFARGKGELPRVHARLPRTTFEQCERPTGPLPDAIEEMLERYYLVKLGSLQFCGATNFGMPFWEGFESLAQTLPIILWLARAFSDRSQEAAFAQAVGIVDNQFGYNPILGTGRQRLGLRLLAGRGEVEKLIAWYSR